MTQAPVQSAITVWAVGSPGGIGLLFGEEAKNQKTGTTHSPVSIKPDQNRSGIKKNEGKTTLIKTFIKNFAVAVGRNRLCL